MTEEEKYLVAREEYALAQKAFYELRITMSPDKRLRSLSQKTDYEYARIQVSNAAKRMQDALISWRAEERLLDMSSSSELEPEEQKAKYGNVSEATAKSVLEAIEKSRRGKA